MKKFSDTLDSTIPTVPTIEQGSGSGKDEFIIDYQTTPQTRGKSGEWKRARVPSKERVIAFLQNHLDTRRGCDFQLMWYSDDIFGAAE